MPVQVEPVEASLDGGDGCDQMRVGSSDASGNGAARSERIRPREVLS